MAFQAQVQQQIDQYHQSIIHWANPAFYASGKNATVLAPPTSDYPLARLSDSLLVTAAYLSFVFIGSFIMKRKKTPFDLFWPRVIYNSAQVVLCAYMCWSAIEQVVFVQKLDLICNPHSNTDLRMANVVYVFFLSKAFDYCDTIFIILRQKWVQLSFLHVYHHASVFLVYWLNLNAGYDGDIYFTVVANSFVHFVMYFYYLVSSFGYRPNIVRKNITRLQMFQFILMNIQAIYLLVQRCPYPRNVTWFYLFYVISIFSLFLNFFIQAYTKPKPRAKKD
eukprot:TRINITY_DN6936_c0_g1_i1.p1 TRINITY_DN6936_c0_g1~~TRINITY_DN6936_c0_g1_i1.p1  ORF type:complete len:278 (-),score=82.47 TRINITY_DN6936_c0_g1_i1:144-977(-)